MHLSNQAFVGGAGLLAVSLCFAQPAVPTSEHAASASARAPATAKAPNSATNAATNVTTNATTNKQVLEDDNVLIEESRTRGEVQSITVQSKVPGVKAYNIVPLAARKDPSQEAGVAGLAGKRTWSLLDF
jgi:hypothetical protein